MKQRYFYTLFSCYYIVIFHVFLMKLYPKDVPKKLSSLDSYGFMSMLKEIRWLNFILGKVPFCEIFFNQLLYSLKFAYCVENESTVLFSLDYLLIMKISNLFIMLFNC